MKKRSKRKHLSRHTKTTPDKIKKHHPKKPFTPTEMSRIDHALARQKDLFERILFRLAIDTMLRSSDLLKLRVQDVVSRAGKVHEDLCVIQQKTGVPVTVTFMGCTQKLLAQFIDQKHKKRRDFLFVRRGKKPIHTNYFRRLVKKWAGLAGIERLEIYSGHSTRRSKAMVLYQQDIKVGEISKALGHTSLAVTLNYLGIEESHVKASLQQNPIWGQPTSSSLVLIPPSPHLLMAELPPLLPGRNHKNPNRSSFWMGLEHFENWQEKDTGEMK